MAQKQTKTNRKKQKATDKAQVIRIIVLAFLVVLCLSNFGILGVVGQGIKWLFFGIFGTMDYLLPFYCGSHIIWRMVDKNPSGEIRKRVGLGYLLMALIDGFIQRIMNVPAIEVSTPGDVFLHGAVYKEGGGFIGGLIAKALSPTLLAGTIIILLGLMALCVIAIVDSEKLYEKVVSDEKQPTKAQLKKQREEERRQREEDRLHREALMRERELERESKRQVKEERRENERVRAHERELKRIEREKELLREQQEMDDLAVGVNRVLYEEETGQAYDHSKLVRSSKKARGVGDFSVPGAGGQAGAGSFDGTVPSGDVFTGPGSERSRTNKGTEFYSETDNIRKKDGSGGYVDNITGVDTYKDNFAGTGSVNSDNVENADPYPEQFSQSGEVEGYIPGSSLGFTLPDDETDRAELEELRRRRREERKRRSDERKGIRPAVGTRRREKQEQSAEGRPASVHGDDPGTASDSADNVRSDEKRVIETETLREGRPVNRDAGTADGRSGTGTQSRPVKQAPESFTPAEYEFPPLSLLNQAGARSGVSQNENRRTAALLLQTLETFGVKAEITDISCGPAVTRFEIQPPIGTRVSKIVSLSDEIKLNLAAEDIRIEAPIPGKPAIGIEIPNKNPSSVSLYELLDSAAFANAKSLVSFAVGEDITGTPVIADIAKMPHILIAGQTGSGKSVCINSLIMSVLYKARPDQVKMIMVDPKVVELSAYNGIPHLLFPVVTDPRKASGVLNWTVAEMEARYKRFEETGVKNIAGYNDAMSRSKDPEAIPMPQLLVIIDELADLMMVAKGDVETAICRLAQLARAAGIHLIIATQRPSVNVITGLIKANVPSKIAFAVASGVDSRTILDMNGAEKLLGKGDMLFFPTGMAKPKRVQGAFVSDEEVAAVVDFLRERNGQADDEDEEDDAQAEDTVQKPASPGTLTDISSAFNVPSDDDRDELFEEAARFVIEKERGSIGMLQRNFKIGFNRAGRIMDQLADAGIVGPDIGTKPRQVLVTMEELDSLL